MAKHTGSKGPTIKVIAVGRAEKIDYMRDRRAEGIIL